MVLSTGRAVNFDLSKLTIAEYRALFDKKQSSAEEDAIMSKVSGLTVEEIGNLSYIDWKRFIMRFFARAREPVQDPN